MKLCVFLLAFGLGVSLTTWAEEECEFAVDMSDSHDFEDFHNCEQASSGLNRLLKDLTGRETQAPLKTTNDKPLPSLVSAENPAVLPQTTYEKLTPHETPAPGPLEEQRLRLFTEMTQVCAKGFSIEAEEYRPHVSGGLLLTYQYRCL